MGRMVTRVFLATVLACLAMASTAAASGEITDPCGLGSGAEPVFAWVDLCSADIAGKSGSGTLRAVETVIRLDGDVTAGDGRGEYSVGFNTDHCQVWQRYRVQPGLIANSSSETVLTGTCDFQTTPCPWPRSEISFWTCGASDTFEVVDSPALSVAVAGPTVTLTLDPNDATAGSVPTSLLNDLQPGDTLSKAFVNTLVQAMPAEVPDTSSSTGMDYGETTAPVGLGS